MGEQQKLNEFEPVSYEAWLKLVERDLQGVPFDKKLVKRVAGIEIQPLYTRDGAVDDGAGLPGSAPFTRGADALAMAEAGWDVRFELAYGDLREGARSIADNLAGGASSIALVLDRAARAGTSEHGIEGVAVENLSEFDALLAHVPLAEVPVTLDAGASALPAAAGLIALARHRKVPLEALSGSYGIDPLGTLATYGALPCVLDVALGDAAEATRWSFQNTPRMRALTVDTSPYHEAGADAPFEIALALATGLEYLRALTRAGLSVDEAASQILFRFSVGRDFFIEIAKLRVARRTWARVLEACGGSVEAKPSGNLQAKPSGNLRAKPSGSVEAHASGSLEAHASGSLEAQPMRIHARTSRRTKTQRDPWVNLLRGTAESFAAVVGGADAITTHGFDAAVGDSDAFGQRMARNTQHLLRHEANLHRVIDPAGGSWYVEAITESLAARAWERLQSIERSGGMARAILEGSVQQELQSMLEAERKAVETRRLAITGVNEFPHVDEVPVVRTQRTPTHARQRAEQAAEQSSEGLARLSIAVGSRFRSAIDAAGHGAAFGALRVALGAGTPARCRALVRERLAQPFEALRDRADALGGRPRVFLANLGPIPEHKARAGYAQNFLEAGGLRALTNEGFASAEAAAEAFAESGATLAAICASDALYAELAEPTARALRAKGARAIVLAGAPGEREAAYRAAGVSDFIHVGINAAESLRLLLERAGA